MQWFFYIVSLFPLIYVAYVIFINRKQKKRLNAPRCEKCGSPMELQTKSGDGEIWACPVCRDKKRTK